MPYLRSGTRNERMARALLDAEAAADPIAPLTDAEPDLSAADAYAIQRIGRDWRVEAGARVVGRKVGLTSTAMQEMLGVDQPDFGYLLEAAVLESGAAIDTARLIAPRVEAEIAFFLDREVAGPDVTPAQVLEATAEVAPALEVIDSRIADWRIKLVDTIADNASGAMAVLGPRTPLDQIDLQAEEMTLDVGAEQVSGRGEAVLGHPARAVAWLARALAPYGESLQAGEVVLPGAMAKALPVAPGATARARFRRLGEVVAAFE
jgi:2-oxopent-4-enoate hydratase